MECTRREASATAG